jgi:hypothetical protein
MVRNESLPRTIERAFGSVWTVGFSNGEPALVADIGLATLFGYPGGQPISAARDRSDQPGITAPVS